MSKERDKLLVSAQKLAQRGQIDKAIKEYQAALQLDKKDVKTLLRLGDLLSKSKKNDEAMKSYAEAAKLYTRDGFYSKAIAVYKRVLELDENRDDIYLLMADLYQRLGMVGDAMTQYQRISSNYEKDGKVKEALDIYRNMAELDPRNILILTKLAELNYKTNNPKEGYTIFKRALDELKEQNRFEEYTRLMEKLARADPQNVENLKELCTIYIKRKVYDRAYPFLVKVCQVDAEDLQSLSNLGELCVKLNKKDEAVLKFKELSSAYQKKGLRQKAQEALNRIAEIEGKQPAKAAAVEHPAAAPAQAEEVVDLAEEVGEVREVEVEGGVEELNEAAEEEAVIEERETQGAAPDGISADKIQENLTEADVYFKYGLRDKALGHIQLVLQSDPKNVQALKRLKNIMLDAKNQDAGLDALRKIALYSDKERDWKNLAEASAEILKMVPADAPAQAWLKKADAELSKQGTAPPAAAEAAEEKTEEPEVIEEEVVVAEEEQAKPTEMPPKVPAPPRAPAKAPAAKPAAKAPPAPGFKEEIEEAEFYVQQGLEEEALRVYLEILQTDPSHKQAVRRVKELEAVVKSKAPKAAAKPAIAIEEEPQVVAEEEEVAEEVMEEEPQAAAEPPSRGPKIEVPAEMSEAEPQAAEEPAVEFEAPPATAEEEEVIISGTERPVSFKPPAPGKHAPRQPPPQTQAAPTPISIEPSPPHTDEVQKQPVSAETAASAGPPVHPVVDETAGLFDLAAELEKEDLGPAPSSLKTMSTSEKYSFEDMFKSFKEGVSKVVSENDATTHYDLGIAYKEMGLAEDAVREFQAALKAGHSPGDCFLMVGICHAERGKFEQAIEEYEKGVNEPRLTDKEKAALFYELGQAWMGLGDLAKALKMFEKCHALDPGVRDVTQRVEQLRARLGGAKPEVPAAPSREGVSWESAALKEPESGEAKEEENAAKKSRKKISYV